MKNLFVGLAAIAASLTAPAQAACWSPAAAEAASVRDFETMLMVSTLRCRLVANDFTEDYNRFIREKRPVLIRINDELRTQFGSLDSYDRYVTSIANSYGAGAQGLSCRDIGSLISAANAQPATRTALVELADRAGAAPPLPSGRCRTQSIALAPIEKGR